MSRAGLLAAGLAVVFTFSTSNAFSQIQAQNRLPQQVVINGLTVNAASVTTATGQIQSFTCSSPQQYTSLDGRLQGWACYDETTGVWLLNAVPPLQTAPAAVQQQPVPSPAPVYQPPVPQQPPVYPQPPVYGAPLPNVVYQQPPAVVYQPAPTVIYQQPAIIYAQPVRPVVVAPAYPPSVVLGAAAIGAVGRIASAAIISSYYPRVFYYAPVRGRRW